MAEQWETLSSNDYHSERKSTGVSLDQPEILGKLNIASFFCASAITIAGLVGACYHKTPEGFEILTSIYLAFFGVMVIILDVPLNFTKLLRLKEIIGKYFRLLTRLTGKGLWFVFLACTSFATLHTQSMVATAYFIALPTGVFGICCVVIGVRKSQRLDRIRRELRLIQGRGELHDTVRQYTSVSYGLGIDGLSSVDFAQMAEDICQIKFSPEDLALSFNALTCERDPIDRQERNMLSRECLDDWLSDGWMLFL